MNDFKLVIWQQWKSGSDFITRVIYEVKVDAAHSAFHCTHVILLIGWRQTRMLFTRTICISLFQSHFFWGPVDTKAFPHYREYIVHPMDLMMLEKNVSNKVYGCTEAFLADVKWIVHNSTVFNSSKFLFYIVFRWIFPLLFCKILIYRSFQSHERCEKPFEDVQTRNNRDRNMRRMLLQFTRANRYVVHRSLCK